VFGFDVVDREGGPGPGHGRESGCFRTPPDDVNMGDVASTIFLSADVSV
jgi:hypothetical protein